MATRFLRLSGKTYGINLECRCMKYINNANLKISVVIVNNLIINMANL
ncbi:hypothetical protein BTHERMOSOX_659 [Bathymodiolus thermophilus thioautotrophic gill symbiont]|nr:hypothetical protein THERMOT_1191 [Bathymodiolus thermophilus thioautotrophic gill symbiont]SGZ74148.1 hypothetical protein BTHERMOSOX_659 [Bathymodiolus thermophilus thioautotrophic gill symbiont]